ncbi:MAG: SAM hydrolase/SAM-dependent halogenase family protein [Microthrixaceae bacterium]
MTGEDSLRYDNVSFLSDYGHADEFVGVVHSVLRALAPGVGIVDITHEVPPFDINAGALTLARSAQYLCPGVVLAVVDPAVGTSRRGVAIEVGEGASVLVGPDNGLLAPAVSLVGGAGRAVELDNPEYHLPGGGNTFDGRDVFAPAAAALCRGVELGDLGSEVDAATLMPATLPLSRDEPDGLHTEVLWVDRFGNVQLNLDPDDLGPEAMRFTLSSGGTAYTALRVSTFDDVPRGTLGLLVDSYGLISVVSARASAAEETQLAAGDEVVLSATDGDADGAGGSHDRPEVVEMGVEIGIRPKDGPR